MITKAEFMQCAEQEYEEIVMCENHARKLERDIAFVREMGFEVIITDSVVTVTRNKQEYYSLANCENLGSDVIAAVIAIYLDFPEPR